MIGVEINRVVYKGDGKAKNFPYEFTISSKEELIVTIVDPDRNKTELSSDYFIDEDKKEVIYPGYATGEEPAEAERPPTLPSGWFIVLQRQTRIDQQSDLGGKWPFDVTEDSLDKITRILQDLNTKSERSLTISVEAENVNTLLPSPEPNKGFYWDETGKKLVSSDNPNLAAKNAQESETAAKNYMDRAETAASKAEDEAKEAIKNSMLYASAAKESAEEAKNYKDIAIAGQLQADWNEEDTSAKSFIKGKPTELLEEMQEHIENLLKKVDYITPQLFGAVGDGETDDTIALKKAIQYAHEKSLKIYIPQGTYCISEPLHIYENQYIFGAGSTNTKIKSSMESTNSSAIIILDRTPDYKFSYGENYTIKDITLTSVNKVAYGIYAEKAAPYIKFSHLSIHTVQTGISIPDTWMSTIDNTNISGIAIGIQLRSQGTSLHLENIYIMTPTKYGYDIHGLSYSEWSNVGCDWATEDAIPYNFSFGNVTINGLGCESEKCKICITQNNSTLNITGATLCFPKTDTGNSVFSMNGSILNITNANISLAGMLPENNTAKVFDLNTNNIIKIKNMSYPDAIKERLSLDNYSSFIHIEDYTSNHSSLSEIPHLGDTNTYLSFFRDIVPYNRKMTTIYGGVNGRNLQLSDGKDISWSPAPKCGDILLNSNPKAGIAFMQCVSDSTMYTLKGTVTSIDGNVVTLSDWGFADDAMTKFATNRGTTINEKGYFNNVNVTSISAEDKQIVLKNAEDAKRFVVGSSITYKNPVSFMRDCKYKVVQQVLADTSTARPTFPAAGMMYFDTTLNKPIWFNGTNWVDVNGNKV